MIRWTLLALIALLVSCCTGEETGSGGTNRPRSEDSWAVRIAASFMERHPDAVMPVKSPADTGWSYEQGLMLEAFHRLWMVTGKLEYLNFVEQNVGHYVTEEGTIRTCTVADLNLDNLAGGRALLHLYKETKQQKYLTAATLLRDQLRQQPRTREGGFWHKKIYPHQMWLDGLYMAEPFYAAYARLTHETGAFDDIANQFLLIYRQTRDSSTGLLYHGWDESKQQLWADPTTGHSPSVWGRAMGWYLMGLVEVLDLFPEDHPRCRALIGVLQDVSSALLRFQEKKTGLWYQVVDQADRPGNFLEASASGMFAYSFARAVRRGYLEARFLAAAEDAFRGITERFVSVDAQGRIDLRETCQGTGLGGKPYRDGSFAYYTGVPRGVNDMKGIGPFLLAAIELEQAKGGIKR